MCTPWTVIAPNQRDNSPQPLPLRSYLPRLGVGVLLTEVVCVAEVEHVAAVHVVVQGLLDQVLWLVPRQLKVSVLHKGARKKPSASAQPEVLVVTSLCRRDLERGGQQQHPSDSHVRRVPVHTEWPGMQRTTAADRAACRPAVHLQLSTSNLSSNVS